MAEIIKETVVTGNSDVVQAETTPKQADATSFQTIQYLVAFFFGALDVFLLLRLVLKLLGASPLSNFVAFIYGLTGLFVAPFEGIFRSAYTEGVETTSVLEPSTIVAIIIYALLAWGIIRLIQVLSGKVKISG